MPSFDTVCEANLVEVKNAVDNTAKEIATRFDFKGTPAASEINISTIVKASLLFIVQFYHLMGKFQTTYFFPEMASRACFAFSSFLSISMTFWNWFLASA